MGSDLPGWQESSGANVISIHAPRVGSDGKKSLLTEVQHISIHAPRVGSDSETAGGCAGSPDFNPRSPCGERLFRRFLLKREARDFNPRSPCGERPEINLHHEDTIKISIHAPRVGSDGCWRSASRPRSDFNPRSPCGERPRSQVSPAQSPQNFNPRSPCGERLCAAAADFQLLLRISIHAPRVGSDRPNDLLHGLILVISIHAPRVGSDQAEVAERTRKINFNPRSPCGERRLAGSDGKLIVEFQSTLPVWGATGDHLLHPGPAGFQSTLPVWGATKCRQSRSRETRFQSTLPVWGATSDLCAFLPTQYNFNPRSPCGERRSSSFSSFCVQPFQSTLPVWGATMISRRRTKSSKNFNPRSPCGERRRKFKALPVGMEFQSTLPVWGATWQYCNFIRCIAISIHAPRVGSDKRPANTKI